MRSKGSTSIETIAFKPARQLAPNPTAARVVREREAAAEVRVPRARLAVEAAVEGLAQHGTSDHAAQDTAEHVADRAPVVEAAIRSVIALLPENVPLPLDRGPALREVAQFRPDALHFALGAANTAVGRLDAPDNGIVLGRGRRHRLPVERLERL